MNVRELTERPRDPDIDALDLEALLRSFNGSLADGQEKRFFDFGGRIKLTNDSNVESSYYQQAGMDNGIVQNGEIVIREQDIESLALSLCTTLEYAAKLIALHEMGHAWSQQRMLESWPGANASPQAISDWCMAREGWASVYAFTVQYQNGGMIVPGPAAQPNLFQSMLNAVSGVDPRSNLFEKKLFDVAVTAFKADPHYQQYCSQGNLLKQKFIGPVPPDDDGAGGDRNTPPEGNEPEGPGYGGDYPRYNNDYDRGDGGGRTGGGYWYVPGEGGGGGGGGYGGPGSGNAGGDGRDRSDFVPVDEHDTVVVVPLDIELAVDGAELFGAATEIGQPGPSDLVELVGVQVPVLTDPIGYV